MFNLNHYHQAEMNRQHLQELLRQAEHERLIQQAAPQSINAAPAAAQPKAHGIARLLKLANNSR